MMFKGLDEKYRKHLKWFIIVFCILGFIANDIYRNVQNTTAEKTLMRNDSEGYYQYLPHFFIMDWDKMDRMHWAKQYGNGKTLNVYTSGVAIMQIPFFLTAHAFSYFFGLEMTGYTPVYFTFVFFASLFYALLGLLFIYRFLRRFFFHNTAFWVMALTFFATNLFYYTTIIPGVSHAYSFCAIALFIYLVPRFYDKPNLKNLIYLSFPLALATLIRPTSICIAFFLFLYGVYGWADLKERVFFWFKKWPYLLVMLLIGFLMFVPQMLYWHTVTGKYIIYSYQHEGFSNIRSPEVTTVLFGARNGWFLYTPLMIFSTISLFYLVYKRQFSSWAILLVMVFIVYINGSWWLPTFSASAGYRTLIEYLPFMAIPLGWFFEKVYTEKARALRWGLTTILVLFVVYNILFSYKYNSGVWWNMEWEWGNFLRLIKF